jgi:hypothetical protein
VKARILNIIIISITVSGLLLLGHLSYLEFLHDDICAKFVIYPACYLAFLHLVIILFSQFYKKLDLFFLIFLGFAIVLVAYASTGHLLKSFQCAISDIGIPTCYIILVFLLLLLVLKFMHIKARK